MPIKVLIAKCNTCSSLIERENYEEKPRCPKCNNEIYYLSEAKVFFQDEVYEETERLKIEIEKLTDINEMFHKSEMRLIADIARKNDALENIYDHLQKAQDADRQISAIAYVLGSQETARKALLEADK